MLEITDRENHINIIYDIAHNFFVFDSHPPILVDVRLCEACWRGISPTYIYIIDSLKKAGLLGKDYPLICCRCYDYSRDHRRGIKEIQRIVRQRKEINRKREAQQRVLYRTIE